MRLARYIMLPMLLSGCMVGPDYQRPEIPVVDDWHADVDYKSLEEPSLQ